MKEKLDLIDTILNDENALDIYIKDIEQENIKTPNKLKNNILNYITSKQNNVQKKKVKMVDILKIAACTILSILLWEAIPMDSMDNMNPFDKEVNAECPQDESLFLDASNLYKELNLFMLKPLNHEGREE